MKNDFISITIRIRVKEPDVRPLHWLKKFASMTSRPELKRKQGPNMPLLNEYEWKRPRADRSV